MDATSQDGVMPDDRRKVGVLRSSYRFLVVLFMMGAPFMSYVLRVNINIAIVNMVVGDSEGRNACTKNPNSRSCSDVKYPKKFDMITFSSFPYIFPHSRRVPYLFISKGYNILTSHHSHDANSHKK